MDLNSSVIFLQMQAKSSIIKKDFEIQRFSDPSFTYDKVWSHPPMDVFIEVHTSLMVSTQLYLA